MKERELQVSNTKPIETLFLQPGDWQGAGAVDGIVAEQVNQGIQIRRVIQRAKTLWRIHSQTLHQQSSDAAQAVDADHA